MQSGNESEPNKNRQSGILMTQYRKIVAKVNMNGTSQRLKIQQRQFQLKLLTGHSAGQINGKSQ